MAYGAILNQKPQKKMLPEIIITPFDDSISYVEIVSPTGERLEVLPNSQGIYISQVKIFGVYQVEIFTDPMSPSTIFEVNVDICKQYNYVFPQLSEILDDNSWATIRYASDNNLGESLWSIGDSKQITINGTIGIANYNNYQPYVYIIGFNHNAELEGSNRIHFQLGKTNDVYIALRDASYGTIGGTASFRMNLTSTNSGGWTNCYMRRTILNGDFLGAINSDLRYAVKPVDKWTDNTGNASNSFADVTITTDYIFLLAEFEVFGTRDYANQYEQVKQSQYDFYKNGNPKVRYGDTYTTTAIYWWLRSPWHNGTSEFCNVTDFGGTNSSIPRYSYGLAPAFCV